MGYKRLSEDLEAKFSAASSAVFALEEAIGPVGSLDRHDVYSVRIALVRIHNGMRCREDEAEKEKS